MDQFTIMKDGVPQAGGYDTLHEAQAAAMSMRTAHPGSAIGVRPPAPPVDPSAVLLQASSPDGSTAVVFAQGSLEPAEAHELAADNAAAEAFAAAAAAAPPAAAVDHAELEQPPASEPPATAR